MSQELHRTDLAQVFSHQEILLTGANGFLGKVLLGLLLDRFPELKHLHILLRAGRSLPAEQRFQRETLTSPALAQVIERITQTRGSGFVRERITVWPGDIRQPHCGLSPAALDHLSGRLGAIINCAGLVEFFPPLDLAFASNVDGVENTAVLAERLGSKLLHVSTCYVCGAADGLIEETEPVLGYYPHRQGPEDKSFNCHDELAYCRERIGRVSGSARQIENAQTASRAALGGLRAVAAGERLRSREISQRLIALGRQRAEHWGWVNTYTYSKSLGEQVIASRPGLDYAIVRPAIVESALRFPFPGWIEGGRTAAPLVLMALGGLRDWPVRRDIPLEVVPVDLVAAAILVVAALLLEGRNQPVYQLGSADVNPLELEPLVRLLHAESRRRMRNQESEGNGRRKVSFAFLERLLGAGPAGRRRPRFLSAEQARARRVRLQQRIGRAETLINRTSKVLERAGLPGRQRLSAWSATLRTLGLRSGFHEQTLDQYLPFVLHNRYIFESEHIREAYSLISEKDRLLLPWDPERIDWEDYWINHQIKGIETWVQPEAVKEWNFRI